MSGTPAPSHEHEHYHVNMRLKHSHAHRHLAKDIERADHASMRHTHPNEHAGLIRMQDNAPDSDVIEAALYIGTFLERLTAALEKLGNGDTFRCPFCHGTVTTPINLVSHLAHSHLQEESA